MGNQYEQLRLYISEASSVAIFGHQSIDGDALWGMLGLGNIMEKIGKKVSYFCPTEISSQFNFIPDVEKITKKFKHQEYDLMFFIDFTEFGRIEAFTDKQEEYFEEQRIIIIDHHIGKNHHALIDIKDEKAASTCEIIREMIQVMWPEHINKTIATQLYLGLITDTGNFLFDTNPERTLRNALWLVQAGADKMAIVNNMFRSKSFASVQFMQTVLARMQRDKKILWARYSEKECDAAGVEKEEAESALHIMQNIEGAALIVYFEEKKESIKIHLRGKGEVNCQKIAKLFNGGGHINASGATIKFQIPVMYKHESYIIGPGDYDIILKIIQEEMAGK
jgi:bifunctional oligoribonuclease and PAP phosphatase NrnA